MKSVHSLLQVNAHFYAQQNQWIRNKISKPCRKRVLLVQWELISGLANSIRRFLRLPRASDSFRTKWTFDLSMHRAASGRHISEANANRFALSPQVHCTKPFDNLCQQASIRQR